MTDTYHSTTQLHREERREEKVYLPFNNNIINSVTNTSNTD